MYENRNFKLFYSSVVVCTMEWNRWPLPPGKCQPFAFDKNQLGEEKLF